MERGAHGTSMMLLKVDLHAAAECNPSLKQWANNRASIHRAAGANLIVSSEFTVNSLSEQKSHINQAPAPK